MRTDLPAAVYCSQCGAKRLLNLEEFGSLIYVICPNDACRHQIPLTDERPRPLEPPAFPD